MEFTTGLAAGLLFGAACGLFVGFAGGFSVYIRGVSDSDTEIPLPNGYQPSPPKQSKAHKRRRGKRNKRPKPPKGGSGVPNRKGG